MKFYGSIQFQNWVSWCNSSCTCVIHGYKAKYTKKRMKVEIPTIAEILKKYTMQIFPRMELLRIGHIDVEFILNCVDFWTEFGIE